MGSLLAEGNKKAKANHNIIWLKKCVFMGLGEWNFCLKRLSAPTKTLPLLFEAHHNLGRSKWHALKYNLSL
ncbi:hypothetical protein [Helicobacter pylori]|uniref:hypothetical protein n=1 Tax=Helicobacter pylori TaxID=210 RepID=UPI000FDF6358|nr:hypothetical protein ECC14_07805 [Helicobacter pylori]